MDQFSNSNDLTDQSLDNVEIVNKFLRESPDPTKDIAENVDDIHGVLAEAFDAPRMRIETKFYDIPSYTRLYNCITEGINTSRETLSKEFGLGDFATRVMTNDEILDPENDNVVGILPSTTGNPEDATIGMLILKRNLQTHVNENIYYVPSPKELMATLSGD